MIPFRNNWRRTISLFALTGLVEALAFGHLSAFTPLYLRDLQVPAPAIGWWTGVLSSAGFVIGLPLLPFWGVLADRFGRKIVILRSSIFAVIIYGLAASAGNVYWLLLARFMGGFVLGNTGVMMAVQAEITPKERLGSAVAIISSGAPIGISIGPALGGFIIRQLGIRSLLWMDAALMAAIVIMLVLFLKDETLPAREPSHPMDDVRTAIKDIVHTPSVMAVFSVVLLAAFGISMVQPYSPLVIESLFHGPHNMLPQIIGNTLTFAGIAMAAGTPCWGGMGDRFGYLRIFRLSLFVLAVAVAIQTVSQNLFIFTCGRALQGLCAGGATALSMTLLAQNTPLDKRNTVLTMSLLPQQIAWFSGPIAAAMIAPAGLKIVFGVATAMVCSGILFSRRIKDHV